MNMTLKKWCVLALTALMILPAYSYAAPGSSGSSTSSLMEEQHFVPITISKEKSGGTFAATSGYRNQIGEMAMIQETENGYKLSLKIGTLSRLNMVQIVKQEKTEEMLELTVSKVALGKAGVPEGLELPTSVSVSEEANDYYLSPDEILLESYEQSMDTGLLTFPINDLETPIIIRTYSDAYSNAVVNHYIELTTDDLFDCAEVPSEETSWDKLWMGYPANKQNSYLAQRTAKRTNGETAVLDTGFGDKVQVQKQEDGKIKAVLTIKEVTDNNAIQKIEIATSRPPETNEQDTSLSSSSKYYLNDYWANYDEIEMKDGKVTLYYDSFEQMAMGTIFRITTTVTASANVGKKESACKYYFSSLYIVPELGINTKMEKMFGDVKLSYWSKDYSEENSTFDISTDLDSTDFMRSILDSYIGFAKDSRVYSFTALENGIAKDPFSPVQIVIPVPDDWDLDRIYVTAHDGQNIWPYRPGNRLDKENRTITLSYTQGNYLNGSFIMYDAGEPEDLTALSDGIYKVKVSIASKTDPLQTSMANESFSSIPAYLEVKNGEIELFAEVGGVNFGGQFGYISNMFMGNIDSTDKEEVEYLDYQTENGKPIWLTDGETYSAFNIKRIRTKLTNPMDSGNYQYAYPVGFWVPIMDGMTGGNPGSGTGAQPAFLRVNVVERVEENPLSNYDNTVAMVAADQAQFYLDTTDGLSEEKKAYIGSAISRADEEIESWGDRMAEKETIFAVCDHLKIAMDSEPLKSGRYQIPFSDEADASDLKDAYVTIRNGDMTIQLEMADGSSMPDVEYCGEYGSFLTDAQVSEDGKKVTFVILYTESNLLLRIGGSQRTFALDFANANLVSTNLSELEEVVKEAKAKLETEGIYTVSTLEALQTETEKAETLLENFDTEQAEVDVQKAFVRKALDNLKEIADLTELRSVLLNASKEAADKTYTQSSREQLLDLITDIKGYIREEDNVSVEDAEDYVKQLTDMMDALETQPDDDDNTGSDDDGTVESLANDYRSWYKEDDFTEESWNTFAQALENAEALGSDLSEKENQEAIDELLAARDGLIRKNSASEELEELQQTLEEIQEAVEEHGFAGYIGYDALMASIDAADMVADGSGYISGSQITLLRTSMETQYAAMAEEDNTLEENTAFLISYLDYIPSVELEELEKSEETLEEIQDTAFEESEHGTEAESEESTTESTEESTETESEENAKKESEEDTREEIRETTEEAVEEKTVENQTSEAESVEETAKTDDLKDKSESEDDFQEDIVTEESDTAGSEGISESEETGELLLSMSTHYAPLVMASMNSIEYQDGTYYVDYDLYKWDENKLSMGNPALDYGTEPGRIILNDGIWTLYIRFNQMEYDGIVGELKSMERMTNISTNDDGLVYSTKKADYPASISNFPEVLGFTVNPDDDEIPVLVNVPVMTTGPIQPARLKVDWDSLEYINGSVDINSSMDLSDLESAVKTAKKLKKADYTSWSWKVVEENLEAAEDIKAYVLASQSMIDARAQALNAAMEALVEIASDSDYSKLSDTLLNAYIADETDYSKNAWMELERARSAAEKLQNTTDVTSGMIHMAIQDLEEAISRTGTGNLGDNNQSAGLRYSTLNSLINLLDSYDSSDYTEASWKRFLATLQSAKEVLTAAKNGKTTQSEIDNQVELLKDARSGLISNTPVKTAVNMKYLNALISRAEEFLKLSSGYTDASVRRLKTEYDLAVTMTEDADATQDDVDEQKEALRTAINSLAVDTGNSGSSSGTSSSGSDSSSGSSGSDKSKSDEDDGYYKVSVRLWHATLNKASMGDPAINQTAYVHIDDGDITMRLQTKKMTTSGITTHLYGFWLYDGGSYDEAELVSTENSKWIYEFELPNDTSSYYKCQVDPRVDVMGTDPVKARLKVTWSSMKEVSQSTWDGLTGDVDEDDDEDGSSSSSSGSGSGSGTTLTSAETGIRVNGKMSGPGYLLEAVHLLEGGTFDMASSAMSNADVNQFVVYDVKLRQGSSYVQPSSAVTLSIPIPAGYDTKKLELYRVNDDGTKNLILGKVNGSYYEASVDHFSLYILAESNHETISEAAVPASGTTGRSSQTSSSSGSSSGSASRRSTNTGSTKTSTAAGGQTSAAAHMVDGRQIPYTGDDMPVKELAGIGFFAMLVCLGTVIPGKKRKEEE